MGSGGRCSVMGTRRGHGEGVRAGDGCAGQRGRGEQAGAGGREHGGPLEKAGGGKAGQREEMKKLGRAGTVRREGGGRAVGRS